MESNKSLGRQRLVRIGPNAAVFLAIGFYIAGLFFMPSIDITRLKDKGLAKQEQYTYIDGEGEERESETLIEIAGIGRVLIYVDIYFATIPFLLVSCALAKIIFDSTDEIRFMIFTNCILGLLLILLTTKQNIWATILYWCGIITASYALKRK